MPLSFSGPPGLQVQVMDSRERVFIGIGSNRGSRRKNCLFAMKSLNEAPELRLIRTSPFYETPPWGLPGQRPFINAVIEARTTLGPYGLLTYLKRLERRLGRERGRRWGPRVIDLDILFFGRRVIDGPCLTVPHPRLHERAFVMVPMVDIAPDFIHPLFNESIRGLIGGPGGGARVKRLIPDKI